jgi:hypothetical protein
MATMCRSSAAPRAAYDQTGSPNAEDAGSGRRGRPCAHDKPRYGRWHARTWTSADRGVLCGAHLDRRLRRRSMCSLGAGGAGLQIWAPRGNSPTRRAGVYGRWGRRGRTNRQYHLWPRVLSAADASPRLTDVPPMMILPTASCASAACRCPAPSGTIRERLILKKSLRVPMRVGAQSGRALRRALGEYVTHTRGSHSRARSPSGPSAVSLVGSIGLQALTGLLRVFLRLRRPEQRADHDQQQDQRKIPGKQANTTNCGCRR